MRSPRLAAATALITVALAPQTARACACGCGIFDVGGGIVMPGYTGSQFSAWFRFDYMNQNQNWEGSSKAPAADNGDKEIRTSFYTVGGEYMIDDNWTVMAELPLYDRHFTSTDDGTIQGPSGSAYTAHLEDFGDLQLTGVYTGIADDLSTGITFGVKLPTGNSTGPNGSLGGPLFDRDSLPGTGSTDLMIGGYHFGGLNTSGTIAYFIQARYQFAVLTQGDYRPGNELDGAVGLTYDFGAAGPFTKVAPVIQMIGSYRENDSGALADPLNSGYKRLLVAPGIEARIDKVRLYADIELPVYQYTNAAQSVSIEGTSGQLIASALYKLQLSYDF